MSQADLQHLSRITTLWTVVFQAHRGQGEAVTAAQEQLLGRYAGAIYRYLMAALGDPHAAEELAQEFALAFVQGNFHGADPERGRFRDYVKTAVLNLVRKHRRRESRQPANLAAEVDIAAAPTDNADDLFLTGWRDELLARTWETLAQADHESGQLFHTMLSYRTQHPEVSSAQMAEELSRSLGKKLTAAGVRQTIHRARAKFAELLLDEVGRSLETGDLDRIELELIDLALLAYCQDALKARRAR